VKLLDKYRPGMILSFHTWKPILNYNGECRDIADFLAKSNNYETASDIGYPTPGSLGTFATEKYNCPVLTFECPELKKHRETLKEIWQENEKGLKDLFGTDLIWNKLK
jgi:protein MpaA